MLLTTHTGGADQVVGVGLGPGLAVVGDAADHHHGGAAVAADLHPGERLLVRGGPLALQRPRSAALDSDVVYLIYRKIFIFPIT